MTDEIGNEGTAQPVTRLTPIAFDLSEFPDSSKRQVIATVPSGEIRLELGADGVHLLFDCDCLDALPYCKAQCCSLIGIDLTEEEQKSGLFEAYPEEDGSFTLKRGADGFCNYLDRSCRMCGIYEQRPETCRGFHCTRGHDVRGWKLSNRVERLYVE